MYRDFKNFGIELENLNEKISKILILGETDMGEEIINKIIVGNFHDSNLIAADYFSDYYNFEYMYNYKISRAVENILSDGKIADSEEKYLSLLYSYNDELIKEYNNLLDKYNEKGKISRKKTFRLYNEFSSKAEGLLNTSKYRFLQNYVCEFKKGDIEEAKKYCEEIFAKVVENKELKYSKVLSEDLDAYVYETEVHKDKGFQDNEDNIVEYNVEFNNKTGRIDVGAVAYTVFHSTNLKDKEKNIKKLDNMAKEAVSKFSNDLINYKRKVVYDDENSGYIEYYYIEKDKGIYDEMKSIKLVLEEDGLISNFSIVYPNNKEIVSPKLSKDDILKKLDKKAEIKDIFIIRNLNNEIEYEVHLKYNDDIYATVFDGNEGNLKYYGKEMRKYNSEVPQY